MPSSSSLSSTIRKLYGIVQELETEYADEKRHFTLDGHLVGSIGEVYAAKRYGIELFGASKEIHDGTAPDGRLVQIKATQGTRIGISSEPKYLIVLHISRETGEFEEVYNGPGAPVWEPFKNRKPPKNGQFQVSLSRLRELDTSVSPDCRIPIAEPDSQRW